MVTYAYVKTKGYTGKAFNLKKQSTKDVLKNCFTGLKIEMWRGRKFLSLNILLKMYVDGKMDGFELKPKYKPISTKLPGYFNTYKKC